MGWPAGTQTRADSRAGDAPRTHSMPFTFYLFSGKPSGHLGPSW